MTKENPPMVKDSDNPFSRDYSGKLETFAKNLTTLIESKANGKPLVISLSAPWGMGKTTFVDMWTKWLAITPSGENAIIIKYDAWREDYSENPLLSILATINEQLEDAIVDEIKPKGLKLAAACIPALSKFIISNAAGYLGVQGTSELYSDLKEATEIAITKEIDCHKEKENAITQFKTSIRTLLKKDEKTNKTLFFFIDELDRCKPTFALSILETIKHFFDIENVCFILVNNQDSLFNMFEKVYGHPKEYFERFIDKHIRLPAPDIAQFIDYTVSTFSSIPKKDSLLRYAITTCCISLEFSFRDIQKYGDDITDFIAISDSKFPAIYLPAIAVLLAIKRKNPKKYDELLQDEFFQAKLKELKIIQASIDGTFLEWTVKLLIASKDITKLSATINELGKAVASYRSKMTRMGLDDKENILYKNLQSLMNNIEKIYGRPPTRYSSNTEFPSVPDPHDHLDDAKRALDFMQHIEQKISAPTKQQEEPLPV